MPEYLAKYTVKSIMYDGGAWFPDPDPHYHEHLFEARDGTEAKKMAEEYKSSIGKEYFGPRITLDSLLKVENVDLKR